MRTEDDKKLAHGQALVEKAAEHYGHEPTREELREWILSHIQMAEMMWDYIDLNTDIDGLLERAKRSAGG